MFKLTLALLILSISVTFSARAQYKGLGSWNIITVSYPGSAQHHWGGYFEAQERNYGVVSHFYYYEAKAGISYNFDNTSSVLVGTGRYSTYGYDAVDEGPQVTETRLWEQFINIQYLGRIKFEHRYRVEQRFINTGYRNRFRYRLNVTVPINKPKVQPGTFFVSTFDEVFLNNIQPNFERNRVSSSLGYQFSKTFNLQAGYMNQYNNNSLNLTNDKNYLILTAVYQILRK